MLGLRIFFTNLGADNVPLPFLLLSEVLDDGIVSFRGNLDVFFRRYVLHTEIGVPSFLNRVYPSRAVACNFGLRIPSNASGIISAAASSLADESPSERTIR